MAMCACELLFAITVLAILSSCTSEVSRIINTLYPFASSLSLNFKATFRLISASVAPSENVIPSDMAILSFAPAFVVPPVTLAVPSGCVCVFCDEPPLVPCPAFTVITIPFGFVAVVL